MNWTLIIAVGSVIISLSLAINQIYDSVVKRRQQKKEAQVQQEVDLDSASVNQINATLKAMQALNEQLDDRTHKLEQEIVALKTANHILTRRDLVRERREAILRNLIQDKLGQPFPPLPALPQIPDLDSLMRVS